MEEKNHFKMINFRLNLEKPEEKEIFDLLEEIDHGTLKECYGNKSTFIKRLLMDFLHDKKSGSNQNILKDKECQMEKNFQQRLEEVMRSSKEELLLALPVTIKPMLEEVITTRLHGIEMQSGGDKVGTVPAETIGRANGTQDEKIDGMTGDGAIQNAVKENASAVLPDETENLPEEALNYFLGL